MAAIEGIPWLWVSIIGLGIGMISGGFGVGSAIILIPALVYTLAVEQKTAQGISLVVMVPVVLISAIRYYINPHIQINLWIALILVITGVIGAYIGSSIAFVLPAAILKKGFAVFVIIAGMIMLWK